MGGVCDFEVSCKVLQEFLNNRKCIIQGGDNSDKSTENGRSK